MNRRILSPKVLFYAFLLIVLDICVMPYVQLGGVRPQLGYLLILYAAFKWHWRKSIPMAMVIGVLYDFLGSLPFGVTTISLLLACFILNLAIQKIERYVLLMQVVTSFLFVAGVLFFTYLFSTVLGQPMMPFWSAFFIALASGFYSAAVLPVFFEISVMWFGDREYLKQYELFH